MSYKTLLVHSQTTPAADHRIAAAAALALRLDALLIGLAAEAIPSSGLGDPYGYGAAQWIPLMTDAQTQNIEAAKANFAAKAQDARTEWRSVRDRPTPAMARMARAADLVVASAIGCGEKEPYNCVDTAELVITCGRPVLVTPVEGGLLNPRRILVAWKDSRESRRAVADALPLLMLAEEVLVLSLCDAEGLEAADFETDEVVGMLKRHGVAKPHAQAAQVPHALVESTILDKAEAFEADLIVAGGYGHSRATEWVLGGVTRTLLHQAQRFVLLSH